MIWCIQVRTKTRFALMESFAGYGGTLPEAGQPWFSVRFRNRSFQFASPHGRTSRKFLEVSVEERGVTEMECDMEQEYHEREMARRERELARMTNGGWFRYQAYLSAMVEVRRTPR
jgi:hypothetical protein